MKKETQNKKRTKKTEERGERTKSNSYGITLIALVITVIVLLILAGISISMLSGDDSILNKAGQAREMTGEKSVVERIQLAYHSALTGGQGNYTKDTLMKELENEFKTNYDVDDTDETNWVLKAQGQSVIIPAGQTIKIDRSGILVGDYVNYIPKTASTTYLKDNLDKAHTGSTNNYINLMQESLKWRVLKIYDNGRIDLIADPTNSSVYFKGATGYNNGVYIMHDICEKLYSNTDHNVTARSIKLEDFEDNMTSSGKNARANFDNYGNSPKYAKTNYEKWNKSYTKDNSYYPNIYASENGSGIDTESGITKTNGILDTEKGTLDLSTGNDAYKQAEICLTAKHTYYSIYSNFVNYGDASKVLSNNEKFWVASRTVICNSDNATFGLRTATTYSQMFGMFFGWNKATDESKCKLRPVVSLNPNIQITPSNTASSETGTPHTINW